MIRAEEIEKLEQKLKDFINLSYLNTFSDEVKFIFLTTFYKKNELHKKRADFLMKSGYVDKNIINELKKIDEKMNDIRKKYNIERKLVYISNIPKK